MNKHCVMLDVLSKGLSSGEFPNPERVGCPGTSILEGIASHRIPLAEAEKWLDHLGSCSPCFQEFTAIRNQRRRRRNLKWGGGLALLAVSLVLGSRCEHIRRERKQLCSISAVTRANVEN